MRLRRIIPFLLIALTMAGCFRQSADTFDTVDSTGNGEQIIITEDTQNTDTGNPTEEDVVIIDPDDPDNSENTGGSEDDMSDATPTEFVISRPTSTPQPDSDASPTIVIIQSSQEDATDEPTPNPNSSLATATEARSFITPDVVQELVEPTVTVTPRVTAVPTSATANDDDEGEEEQAVAGDCEYQIQVGDTLYGISLEFDTSVEDIKALNDFTGDLINIGQIIKIPDCGENVVTEPDGPTSTPSSTPTPHPDGIIVHTVQSGDTLYDIAIQYGTTITAIRDENGLGSNVIRPGQQLRVPVPASEVSDEASGSSTAVPTATRASGN